MNQVVELLSDDEREAGMDEQWFSPITRRARLRTPGPHVDSAIVTTDYRATISLGDNRAKSVILVAVHHAEPRCA